MNRAIGCLKKGSGATPPVPRLRSTLCHRRHHSISTCQTDLTPSVELPQASEL